MESLPFTRNPVRRSGDTTSTPGTCLVSSATCWLNGTNDEVPSVRSAFSVSVKVLSTDARSDADSTVTITMSPSPIISADAVDAVRRGFRIAFSRPSLADMLMPGSDARSRRPAAREASGDRIATPMNTTAAPAPINDPALDGAPNRP